ncbi:hypothetical protein S245_066862, partial [Arachis hypogaea]
RRSRFPSHRRRRSRTQSPSSPRRHTRHRSRSTSSPSPPPPKSRSPSVVANHHKLKKDEEEKRSVDLRSCSGHGCFVNFEFANHTIITSKCKGPNYPPKECYGAFKEFACPYADVLNDLQNDIYLRIQE